MATVTTSHTDTTTLGKAETTHAAHFRDTLLGHIGFQVNQNFCAWISRAAVCIFSSMSLTEMISKKYSSIVRPFAARETTSASDNVVSTSQQLWILTPAHQKRNVLFMQRWTRLSWEASARLGISAQLCSRLCNSQLCHTLCTVENAFHMTFSTDNNASDRQGRYRGHARNST